jgi:hypothetical protein
MDNAHVLEFFKNLWGLGTEPSFRTGPPAYVARRIDSLASIPGLLKSLKIPSLFLKTNWSLHGRHTSAATGQQFLLRTSLVVSPPFQEFLSRSKLFFAVYMIGVL